MSSVPVPICYSCARKGEGMTCTAYPKGIPMVIQESVVDHRTPYEGDHGIVFEQSPDRAEPDFATVFGA